MLLFQSIFLLLALTSALRLPFVNHPVQAPTKLNFGTWSHSPTVKELDGVVVPVNALNRPARVMLAQPLPASATRINPQDHLYRADDVYSPQNIELARPDEAALLKRVGMISATMLVVTAFALVNLILGGAGVSALQTVAQSLVKSVARLGAVVLVPRVSPSF